MKFEDALRAMRDGHKVTRLDDFNPIHINFNAKPWATLEVCENGNFYVPSFYGMLLADWEIYSGQPILLEKRPYKCPLCESTVNELITHTKIGG